MLIISPSAGRETQILAVKLSGQMNFYLTFDFLFITVLYPMFQDNYLLDPMLYNLLRKILMYYFITLSWGGPIAIFLQLCNYQFELSEASKSSHD